MLDNSSGGSLGPKIASFNCNSLGDTQKRKSVITWLRDKPEDIILVQETHSTPSTESAWRRDWGGGIYLNHDTSMI